MDTKAMKIVATVVLGLIGIYLATLVLGPAEMPFWAEIAKWSPSVLISAFALYAAQQSRDEATSARDTAKAGAQEAKAARDETAAARMETRASLSKRQKRRVEKVAS